MPEAKRLAITTWLAWTLALLACVAVAPGRISGWLTASIRPDGPRLDTAPAADPSPLHLGTHRAVDLVMKEKALAPEESEEQEEAQAHDEPGASSLIAASSHRVCHRGWISPHPIPSIHPLRC